MVNIPGHVCAKCMFPCTTSEAEERHGEESLSENSVTANTVAEAQPSDRKKHFKVLFFLSVLNQI